MFRMPLRSRTGKHQARDTLQPWLGSRQLIRQLRKLRNSKRLRSTLYLCYIKKRYSEYLTLTTKKNTDTDTDTDTYMYRLLKVKNIKILKLGIRNALLLYVERIRKKENIATSKIYSIRTMRYHTA